MHGDQIQEGGVVKDIVKLSIFQCVSGDEVKFFLCLGDKKCRKGCLGYHPAILWISQGDVERQLIKLELLDLSLLEVCQCIPRVREGRSTGVYRECPCSRCEEFWVLCDLCAHPDGGLHREGA